MSDSIPLGSHLVSSRGIYSHHGIYVGDGKVVHYSGLADGMNTGPVEKVTLNEFRAGNNYFIKKHANPRFSAGEIADRAQRRIGENLYSVFNNNCEHFCEWCVNNDHDSKQVTRGTNVSGPAFGAVAGNVARGVVAASGSVAGLSGAGIMSGLASTGALVGGGAVAGIGLLGAVPGAAMASLVNNTVLKDNEALEQNERDSRAVGRAASYAGAAAGTAGSIAAVSALGTAGLSGAGITSGLAAIGATVGGGMATGVVIATAAPVAAAAAVGYGIYKLVKFFKD